MVSSGRSLSTGRIAEVLNARAVPVWNKVLDIYGAFFAPAANHTIGHTQRKRIRNPFGWRLTALIIEAGILLAGVLIISAMGQVALARFSSWSIIIGSLLLLIGIAQSYSKLNLATPTEVRKGKSERAESVVAATANLQSRYAAFVTMIFWIVVAILPILVGISIQSAFAL
ncbi:MAG: hypothetical protein AAF702_36655 [Chloroflexota bacterium]